MSTVPTPPPGPIDPGALRDHLEALSGALAHWKTRDDSKPQPEVRKAANAAMDAIDNAMVTLGRIRAELVDQIRASDDAASARVDRMLTELRAERAGREHYDREDPETGAPLPPGVEGFHPGGDR
jgi:hypothetical protein